MWARNTRQMITQISIHTKDVVSVFPDCNKPQIIHSCSLDKTVHSFDLKQNKKIILHQAKNGSILDMTQRKDHEQELSMSAILAQLLRHSLLLFPFSAPSSCSGPAQRERERERGARNRQQQNPTFCIRAGSGFLNFSFLLVSG